MSVEALKAKINDVSSAPPVVWSVSHADLSNLAAEYNETVRKAGQRRYPVAFELVTEVTFVWSFPAKSAFVTGTFVTWESTIPMTEERTQDGHVVWKATRSLPPGDYQYKFIIDNVWRHAPDQPTGYDERGILNNWLKVTLETCGDPTCFCSSLNPLGASENIIKNGPFDSISNNSDPPPDKLGTMSPMTAKKFRTSTGVACQYVEKDNPAQGFKKTFMHTRINDRPFDVMVVNVKNLRMATMFQPEADGLISRASSFEHFENEPNGVARQRFDPTIPMLEDAAYAAALNAEDGSLPRTAPYRAEILRNDPTELAYSIRARFSSPVLGFNPKECHPGITLTDANHCAVRIEEKGLYKSVRAVLPIAMSQKIYFEFFIYRQSRSGGICVGLSTHELPLTCLVGTRPNSVGFSTSGNLIQTVDGKETWSDFGNVVESGSTIGMLVYLKSHKVDGIEGMHASITFSVNGTRVDQIEYMFQGIFEVFPTLSLFSRNSRVYSLFNGYDMIYAARVDEEQFFTLQGQPVPKDAENTPISLGFHVQP